MAKARIARGDQFPNRALFNVTQSAADTLTFQQVRFGTGLFQGTAIIISKIEWFFRNQLDALAAFADYVWCGLTNRDDLTTLDPANMNVLVQKRLQAKAVGTPANVLWWEFPLISDFSTLPGGGLIYPANPLFVGLESADTGVAGELDVVMYYTTRQLADADYVELVQSLIPVNI